MMFSKTLPLLFVFVNLVSSSEREGSDSFAHARRLTQSCGSLSIASASDPKILNASIGQSNPFTAVSNTLTVTLILNVDLETNSTVTVVGLTGSQTADNADFSVTSSADFDATWVMSSGTLSLTAKSCLPGNTAFEIAFTLRNPAAAQASPAVSVSGQIPNGTMVSLAQATMDVPNSDLLGTTSGSNPLLVVVPALSAATMSQSNGYVNETNTITLSLKSSSTFAAESRITVTGLSGLSPAQFDSSTTWSSCNATGSCAYQAVTMTSPTAGMSVTSAFWNDASKEIVLTVGAAMTAGTAYEFQIVSANPAATQAAPSISFSGFVEAGDLDSPIAAGTVTSTALLITINPGTTTAAASSAIAAATAAAVNSTLSVDPGTTPAAATSAIAAATAAAVNSTLSVDPGTTTAAATSGIAAATAAAANSTLSVTPAPSGCPATKFGEGCALTCAGTLNGTVCACAPGQFGFDCSQTATADAANSIPPTLVVAGAAATVAGASGIGVSIPAGAITTNTSVSVAVYNVVPTLSPSQATLTPAGPVCDFQPEGVTFALKVALTLVVDPAKQTAEAAKGNTFKAHFLDRTTQLWTDMGGTLDAATGKLTTQTDHFSLWTVMSVPSTATTPAPEDESDGGLSTSTIIIIAACAGGGLLLCCLVGFLVMRRRKKTPEAGGEAAAMAEAARASGDIEAGRKGEAETEQAAKEKEKEEEAVPRKEEEEASAKGADAGVAAREVVVDEGQEEGNLKGDGAESEQSAGKRASQRERDSKPNEEEEEEEGRASERGPEEGRSASADIGFLETVRDSVGHFFESIRDALVPHDDPERLDDDAQAGAGAPQPQDRTGDGGQGDAKAAQRGLAMPEDGSTPEVELVTGLSQLEGAAKAKATAAGGGGGGGGEKGGGAGGGAGGLGGMVGGVADGDVVERIGGWGLEEGGGARMADRIPAPGTREMPAGVEGAAMGGVGTGKDSALSSAAEGAEMHMNPALHPGLKIPKFSI